MVLESCRNGLTTAVIGEKYLHSKYDPVKEAKTFFSKWSEDQHLKTDDFILVVEPGLGYLIDEIKKNHPEDNIAVLFLSKETQDYCTNKDLLTGFTVLEILDTDFQTNLATLFSDLDISKIKILEWPASISLFENLYSKAKSTILDTLKIKQGSRITELNFSRIWNYNGVKNFITYDYSSLVDLNKSPVILAASGPTLELHIESIRKLQDFYVIAALPSSMKCLINNGISVDVLFSTDPGFYAKEHLKYLPENGILISPLTAAGPSHPHQRMMGIDQGSFIDGKLLQTNELLPVQEMGTVAATALFALKHLTNNDIFITGLDFCMNDIKMHASPHTFDPFILMKEDRFHPGYNCYFQRAADMSCDYNKPYRYSKSMNTYAGWFRSQRFDSNIYKLNPSPVPTGIQEISRLNVCRHKKQLRYFKNKNFPSYDTRRKRVFQYLKFLESIKQPGTLSDNQRVNIANNIFPKLDLDSPDFSLACEKFINKIMRIMS